MKDNPKMDNEKIQNEIKQLRLEISRLCSIIENPLEKPPVFIIRTAADVMAVPSYTMAGYEIRWG